MPPLPPSRPAPSAPPRGAGIPVGAGGGGRILRLKIGYNPNSSSIGTIVFGMPAALAVFTVAFGTAAGILAAALLRTRGSAPNPVCGSTPSDEPTRAPEAAEPAEPAELGEARAEEDSSP